jgi:hypothetical protein
MKKTHWNDAYPFVRLQRLDPDTEPTMQAEQLGLAHGRAPIRSIENIGRLGRVARRD